MTYQNLRPIETHTFDTCCMDTTDGPCPNPVVAGIMLGFSDDLNGRGETALLARFEDSSVCQYHLDLLRDESVPTPSPSDFGLDMPFFVQAIAFDSEGNPLVRLS